MTEEVTNPDFRSQEERQFDLIRDLNSRVPSNPQGDAADAGLKKILQSLSKNSLSDALRDSFSADKLKEWKEYAEKEFEAMGQINRRPYAVTTGTARSSRLVDRGRLLPTLP